MTLDPPTGAPASTRGIVFTDLDGTLLDHDTYDWAPAAPALEALQARGVALVLASSKTAVEIAPLHRALRLGAAPAIVENGAGVWRPGEAAADAGAYRGLRRALDAVARELRVFFRGFGDMSAYEVAEITGLSQAAAARARTRQYSEPGVWLGDPGMLDRFERALALDGITARRGGRFLTLSHGATKADRMAEIVAGYSAGYGACATLALGDAPNDIEMLEAAGRGVIVRNDHAPTLPVLTGEAQGRISRTDKAGPEGWNGAVLAWLAGLPAGPLATKPDCTE